jgi:carbonic anhydrase
MIKKDSSIPQSDTNVFDSFSEIRINGKVYLLERHFTGKRDFKQAVFSAVENEASHKSMILKSPVNSPAKESA